jgi:hypothetical protein
VGPEIETILGPEMATREALAIWAQESIASTETLSFLSSKNSLWLSDVVHLILNHILHTWFRDSFFTCDGHVLTLKKNTVKCYFGEKSSFLHTFLNFSPESLTINMFLPFFNFKFSLIKDKI